MKNTISVTTDFLYLNARITPMRIITAFITGVIFGVITALFVWAEF